MAIEAAVCAVPGLFCPFIAEASKANLGVVVVGGLIGGLLQPIYQRLSEDHPDPPSTGYLANALLGLAAAGITVYVATDARHEDAIRLLFFAMLCGLAFPSVLNSAVSGLGKRTEDVQRSVAKIASDTRSNDLDDTTKGADQLRTTLADNPAAAIGARGIPVIEASAQTAVRNIAQTAKLDPNLASEVINQLQQLGAVAKIAGYFQTVEAAGEQLAKLGAAQSDQGLKAIANEAAKQFGVDI